MSRWVLDSSAVIAIVRQETGHEKVVQRLPDACISSVNVAEVFSKFAEWNVNFDLDIADFNDLGLDVIDFDLAQARQVAELRPLSKSFGLSLGDRACLALAISQNATAITADQIWSKVNVCPVEIIR